MAQLPVQRGAMTDRLRRFFGITGGFSARVDELLSPVATIADLTQQPYDTAAQRFCCGRREIATGVEARFRVGIKNVSSTLVVIDRMQMQSNKRLQMLIGSETVGGFGLTNNGRSRDLTSLNEGGSELGPGTFPRLVPISSFVNVAAIADNAVTCWVGEANVPYDIEVGWVMPPGQVLYFLVPTPIEANDFVTMNAWGRIMTDPVLSVTPSV